jgi:23S rRNA pseudouridine955/2504/2580 synthase
MTSSSSTSGRRRGARRQRRAPRDDRTRAARPHQAFLELAHRLDRETSGVLMLAKTRRALQSLHEQLREGHIEKRYLLLVAGDWVNDRQHVRLPLTKFINRTGERRVAIDPEGVASHTISR